MRNCFHVLMPATNPMRLLRYYEVELLTYGMVRVGWATKNAPAATTIGMSGSSYSFAPEQVTEVPFEHL